MANNDKIFASDLAFRPKVSNTGDLSIVTNKDAIHQSIYNIIKTRKGSRLGNPQFGAGIESFLFEPMTEDVAQNLGTTIKAQIKLWEPRIDITSMEIIVSEAPIAGYQISLTYIILQTFTEANFQIFLNKLG
jgi:phage baseplate assembly protein W